MKKVLLLLILLMLPSMVDAKEYCKVVSGNGKDIGSEIACGSEHFYILDSNTDEIKMLAKYNLYTGVTIYKEKINKAEGDTRTDASYCSDLAHEKGGTVKSDSFYSEPGYCFYAIRNQKVRYYHTKVVMDDSDTRTVESYCKDIATKDDSIYLETENIEGTYYCRFRKEYAKYNMQTEDAKSAHWDADLNYLYPQVGDVYIGQNIYGLNDFSDPSVISHDIPIQEDTLFYDFDVNLEYWKERESDYDVINYTMYTGHEIGIVLPLYIYQHQLQEMGYSINSTSLLSVSEMNEIAKKLGHQSLPLREWSENFDVIQTSNNGIVEIHFGDIKPFFKEQEWLYSTTYWNSSVFRHHSSSYGVYYVFTAEQGKLCGAGGQICAPSTALGCGIRPVISIPTNELQYLISTKTDGNGTIEVVDAALGNEMIQFKATSKKGYKLKSIVITTDSGEKVEFKEGDIIKNDDGSYTIDKSVFTTPF